MVILLYLDEDSQDDGLVHALRLRKADVLTSYEAGMNKRKDWEQLEFATSCGHVLYSFNTKDFFKLHTEFLSRGQTHAGMILAPQQQFSIGEQTRRFSS
ncbi:MAG: DUF5615 family PIN-like protein [Acidobacteriota bacterium]|nr:DUF5615 family PIN-like protein [Acidobacteriota bacterium]